MVVRCCVPGCITKGTNGFHAFPAKWNVRQEWILRTKVFHLDKMKIVRSWSKVCWKHFTVHDYNIDFKGKKILKPNVVPSLWLPDVTEHNYTENKIEVSRING